MICSFVEQILQEEFAALRYYSHPSVVFPQANTRSGQVASANLQCFGLRFLGLGECIFRKIGVLDDHSISTYELEKQMLKDAEEGLTPFIVVGILGTTCCGAIDNLASLASLALHFGAWFHVDACYGGFFILVEEMKDKMKGIQNADSISIDPHKSLFLPFGTG